MKLVGAAATAALAGSLAAPAAFAQAWVPPAGRGSVTIATQAIENTGHILTDGSTIPVGKSRSASIYLEADYAITDRFSVAAGLPFVFAKYLGPPPPPGMPEPPMVQDVDRCYCWQKGLQDLSFTARFNLLNGSTGITPSISVGAPSHDYGYVGEAVIGRHLRELRLSVDVGRRLDFISPRLAVQGRYSYAIVERVLDVPNNRSNASAEVLLQVTDRLSVHGTVVRQVTHGGLRAGVLPPGPNGVPWGEITTPELFREHDRLLRDNFWRVGGGLSVRFFQSPPVCFLPRVRQRRRYPCRSCLLDGPDRSLRDQPASVASVGSRHSGLHVRALFGRLCCRDG